MGKNKPYSQEHAKALLLPCGEGNPWVIDEKGVRPAASDYKEAERLGLVPEYEVLSWKPVMAFKDDEDAPDCKAAPSLPFPFDARDLAAFMLAGVGAFVADYYGDWEDGPERDALDGIDPSNNYARRAVCEAFDAYREAARNIGDFDYDEDARARSLVRQYVEVKRKANEREGVSEPGITPDEANARRKVAAATVAGLEAEARRAQTEVSAKLDAWRDSMVRELLKPTPPAQPQAAAPAPVVADSATITPEMPVKKAALVAALEHEWPSIEADISEATRNGLKDAAHAGKHGEWLQSKARAWAVSKGKIRQAATAIHPAVWPGTVTRNKI